MILRDKVHPGIGEALTGSRLTTDIPDLSKGAFNEKRFRLHFQWNTDFKIVRLYVPTPISRIPYLKSKKNETLLKYNIRL